MMHRGLLRTGTSLLKASNKQRLAQPAVRHFRKGNPVKFTENKELDGFEGILKADNHKLHLKVFHASQLALFALVPTAMILSPSIINMPVDLALGLLIPVHAHIGANHVISDYVPKFARTPARYIMLGCTGIMFLGFLRLNLGGDGITETIKSVWRAPPKKVKKVKKSKKTKKVVEDDDE